MANCLRVTIGAPAENDRFLEVLKEVRKDEDDSTVVIIFTSDETYRDECLMNGANFFFDKVTEFKLLIDLLENDLLAD